MRRGFKTWAEKQAILYRRQLRLASTAPLPARTLAGHLGMNVIGPRQVPGLSPEHLHELLVANADCWSAVTLPGTRPPIILHNTAHRPSRQESDLMHEIAHVVCKHGCTGITFVGRLPCRNYNADQEEEAEWCGAALQIPREALLWAVRRSMNEEEIAEHFGASVPLVRFRRNKTGVDTQISAARRRRS